MGTNTYSMDSSNGSIYSDVDAITFRPEMINGKMTAILHQNFQHSNFVFDDIALIKTAKPIEFIKKESAFQVNSICLPKPNSEQFGEAILTGWGNIGPNFSNRKTHINLQKETYPLIDKQTCLKIWEQRIDEQYSNSYSNETMICTIAKSSPDILETQIV